MEEGNRAGIIERYLKRKFDLVGRSVDGHEVKTLFDVGDRFFYFVEEEGHARVIEFVKHALAVMVGIERPPGNAVLKDWRNLSQIHNQALYPCPKRCVFFQFPARL